MANALAKNRIHSNNRIMLIGLLAATSVYGLILYMHFAPQSAGDTFVCVFVCVCKYIFTYVCVHMHKINRRLNWQAQIRECKKGGWSKKMLYIKSNAN